MRNLYFGILLLLLIIISLAVGLFLHEFKIITEGYEDTTNKYVDKAKEETIARGYATGYAGSGQNPVSPDQNPLYNYKTDNYNDVEYHESADVWKGKTETMDLNFGNVWVIDANGNKVNIPYSSLSNFTTYNQPGTFTYGASSYVPSYEDSIYLSRSTGLPTVSAYNKNNNTIIPNIYDKQDVYLISRLLQQDRTSALETEEQNKILKTTNSILSNISTNIDKYTKKTYPDLASNV
uniref:Uncharacterized protein n=1 Tax=viral metagenome TaxID=1070528 RepID=A0A6C0E9F7_9ZZZZ